MQESKSGAEKEAPSETCVELWDIVDKDRNPTGKTHVRGKMLKDGEFHVIVMAVIFNSKGEILVTKRSDAKPNDAGMWESTAGSVTAGEDSLVGLLREINEETGLEPATSEIELMHTILWTDYWFAEQGEFCGAFVDVYAVKHDAKLSELVFQEGETQDAKWITLDEWARGVKDRSLSVPCRATEMIENVTKHINGRLRK